MADFTVYHTILVIARYVLPFCCEAVPRWIQLVKHVGKSNYDNHNRFNYSIGL